MMKLPDENDIMNRNSCVQTSGTNVTGSNEQEPDTEENNWRDYK